jgi:hypothetical protein
MFEAGPRYQQDLQLGSLGRSRHRAGLHSGAGACFGPKKSPGFRPGLPESVV